MVNSQHDKSDHEEVDELPEGLEISDNLHIHLIAIKGPNKKLGTRVEELSAKYCRRRGQVERTFDCQRPTPH